MRRTWVSLVVFLCAGVVVPAAASGQTPQTVVAAVGDIVCDPDVPPPAGECRDADTAALVTAAGADRVLALGDLQYSAGSLNDFQTGYDLTWGAHRGITLPTPGNHEYLTSGAAGYYDYWGDAAGPERRGWYSVRAGDWLLLSLNSNCAQAGGCDRDSPQGRWLAAELAASNAACQLAFWHHPRFSSGLHGDVSAVQPLWDILVEHRAELVLAGHDHGFERFEPMRGDGTPDPTGLRSFVVGTGGINLRDFATVRAGSEARVKAYGIAVLSLYADGWEAGFRGIDGTVESDGVRHGCALPDPVAPGPGSEVGDGATPPVDVRPGRPSIRRWSRAQGGRLVAARFAAERGVRYSITARLRGRSATRVRTIDGACRARARSTGRRGLCWVRLPHAGRWLVAVTPRAVGGKGPAARRVVRVRAHPRTVAGVRSPFPARQPLR